MEFVEGPDGVYHVVDFHTRGLISWKALCERRIDDKDADRLDEIPDGAPLCGECAAATARKLLDTVEAFQLAVSQAVFLARVAARPPS